MTSVHQILVALRRPPGYEDVHAELVAEDAMQEDWPWELLRDDGDVVVVAIDRPEDYERSPAAEVALEAVKGTWPAWSVLPRDAATVEDWTAKVVEGTNRAATDETYRKELASRIR